MSAENHGEQTCCELTVRNVTVARDNKFVVRDVNLNVKRGELVSLVGRSGCGKTTLLHALAGLIKPTSGQVYVKGTEVTGTFGKISYMPQKDLLFPHRTVLDNVCLPLIIAGMSKHSAHDVAGRELERFGLAGWGACYPCQLSGGMRQRAALLRTYFMRHTVVLLDEPFSGLDALTRAQVRDWFRAMLDALGYAAVLVTHDVDEALLLADRVVVLGTTSSPATSSRVVGEVDATCFSSTSRSCDVLPKYSLARQKIVALLKG